MNGLILISRTRSDEIFRPLAEISSAVASMGALALSCSSYSKLMGDFCPMPLCLRRGLYQPSIQVKMAMWASAKDF